MKYLLIAILALASCTKSSNDDQNNTTPPETTVDTFGRVMISPYKFPVWDSAGNYIVSYSFSRQSAYSTINYFTANSSGTHVIRYVASEPLFYKDSIIGRGGEFIDFWINPNLKGKPVFQAYDIATGQLYKTYVASPDSAKIMAQHSLFSSYFMADTTIAKYLLYYIHVKQNDNIKYRKSL